MLYARPVSRKFYRADMAAYAGIHPKSLDKAGLPEPDGHTIDRGHAKPWWGPVKAKAFAEARPGKGWRHGRKQTA